jgi:hypothetical protein
MPNRRTIANPELMSPNNSNKHIPSLGISPWIALVSNGLQFGGPLLRFIGDCGLGDDRMCQAWRI